ncbi:helix-turn-helix domain-containing protein [Sphingomonas sp. H39-1-10]|uniref:winged helix-turn-helix transcriptional regulator n=1 Tax=Sphingomonas pollutisoli TaxID=3030829 RepID=UPI0023B8ACA4|nr:helix-turn-helix domain-containing protein [Sphingomonas pollutisoli]MDF0490133.1 helix-turn-helix domain-containing protein [Sphingomonas pollutisoli]
MTYQPKRAPLEPCPVEEVLSIIGGKWKARILLLVSRGHETFSVLARMLPDAPDQVLSTQLKALTDDGMLTKSAPTSVNGAGARYALTADGQSMMALLDKISDWGMARLEGKGHVWSPPADPKAAA